jgi:hypothetical protein
LQDFLALADDPQLQTHIISEVLASPNCERMLRDGPTNQEWMEILGKVCCPIPGHFWKKA